MNFLEEIAKKIEEKATTQGAIGLKDGTMGFVLFFMFYQRFTGNDRYEKITFELLEDTLSKVSFNNSFDYANGIVGIGNTILFLAEEKFVDFDSSDFFNDLDKMVFKKLQSDIVVNFSHDTGITGLCRYAIHRPVKTDAIQHTLNQITKGFEKSICNISPIFLFPSEILPDIKLLLLEISNIIDFQEQIISINRTIEYFESNHTILQSNCPDYKTIQQLREAGIRQENNKIKSLLTVIAKEPHNAVLQGLAYMNIKKPTLPPWWKLF